MRPSSRLDKRHRMHEFGTVFGAIQGIRVNLLEKRLNPLVPFPHRHDFYHLVVIKTGSGWHEIDFCRYPVRPLQVFFMRPGQVHSWRMSENSTGFIVEFGIDAVLAQVPSIPNHINLSTVSKESQNHVLALVKFMLDEYENQAAGFETSLQHYLMILLTELFRCIRGTVEKVQASDPILDRFLELVEEQFRKEHRVEYYAKRLMTTPKALTMRASRALGRSARSVIQERCLLEGQRLLAYSDLTISEIGYELGFEDPNYFSRFFRIGTGASPGDFRAKVRSLT